MSIYLDDTQLKCYYHNIHDLEIHTDLLDKSNIYDSEPEKISQICISNSVYGEYTDFSAPEHLPPILLTGVNLPNNEIENND